ncbi:MAG: hypothetical protein ACMUJM_02180 [bacterium]
MNRKITALIIIFLFFLGGVLIHSRIALAIGQSEPLVMAESNVYVIEEDESEEGIPEIVDENEADPADSEWEHGEYEPEEEHSDSYLETDPNNIE